MGAMSWWHWAIVAIVVIVLFGSKKLPEAARGLGQSLRIFKSEMSEMQNDGKKAVPEATRELPAKPADPSSAPTVDDVKKSA
ncbi:Sec-independent protein translocase subunit TatA [Gordonia sp. (in: high G+C Gram-positive bacteria)]|jgi:sec-independent protein translocase protein TatA|uniref:Sec-independent protein translocase subunit TatA n=1 Tax=Gordonia sp. (in: high G+C Gram-positive bacteria) TaxID=84139 RepID=UPI001DBF21B7|nr:Sec-independent protein translocase subunit TatA [Gordonia sp. (in: high G+C Gram-positive bacteria)]MCB1294112.1 Sec-independent protein translocase subunit TatA [Gordonia sp. (in: high G+C Gram-positive bacteria)]HMS76788.1 Sec-independent protein translocase subunit TatA [Gordonia sp. (in: high G+C Gram-positive bacteria)]HQV18600.1 Sec-independent protein translocase subunit TatA [Gordonia sp. (in: high G+C Gram-positive bacteria)]